MNEHHYVAILAGGKGRRLWPTSTKDKPKQFLDLLQTGETLIQSTFNRYKKFIPTENIFIITNKSYHDLVIEQIPEVKRQNILCEPFRKDTTASITYAGFKIYLQDPEATIIVAPSDQLILDDDNFIDNCQKGLSFAQKHEALVSLGIEPTFPNVNYGYIQRSSVEVGPNVFKIKTFTEKPPIDMAQIFINSGDFLWNSGIFIWTAKSILSDIQTFEPEMYEAFIESQNWFEENRESYIIDKVYSLCPNASLDLSILEKKENTYTIPCSFRWSDLGTWSSMYDQMEKDYYGNVVFGHEKIIADETSKCIIKAPDDKLVIVEGLENYVVVDTDKVLYICKMDHEASVKTFRQEVKKKHLKETFL